MKIYIRCVNNKKNKNKNETKQNERKQTLKAVL